MTITRNLACTPRWITGETQRWHIRQISSWLLLLSDWSISDDTHLTAARKTVQGERRAGQPARQQAANIQGPPPPPPPIPPLLFRATCQTWSAPFIKDVKISVSHLVKSIPHQHLGPEFLTYPSKEAWDDRAQIAGKIRSHLQNIKSSEWNSLHSNYTHTHTHIRQPQCYPNQLQYLNMLTQKCITAQLTSIWIPMHI